MRDPWCDTNLCKYITTVRSSYSVNSGSHILKLISETQQHYILSASLKKMHAGSQPRSSILHTKKSCNIIDGPCDATCKCVCVHVCLRVRAYVCTCTCVVTTYLPERVVCVVRVAPSVDLSVTSTPDGPSSDPSLSTWIHRKVTKLI